MDGEVRTADDPRVTACVFVGPDEAPIEHDYRPYYRAPSRKGRTSWPHWRCVWCHVVSCGTIDEDDPCIEARLHEGSHRTRLGLVWPNGVIRPVLMAKT